MSDKKGSLILNVKPGEFVKIGDDCEVHPLDKKIRLRILAPPNKIVYRVLEDGTRAGTKNKRTDDESVRHSE